MFALSNTLSLLLITITPQVTALVEKSVMIDGRVISKYPNPYDTPTIHGIAFRVEYFACTVGVQWSDYDTAAPSAQNLSSLDR